MEGHQFGLKKGVWTLEEDLLLKKCIETYGEGKWHRVPLRAGLNRCRKSCRLRWLNYLKPGIIKGEFSEDEVDLIIRLHKLLGNRWSLIAGRLPGRTAKDVKNYWNKQFRRKTIPSFRDTKAFTRTEVIKTRPRIFAKNIVPYSMENYYYNRINDNQLCRPFSDLLSATVPNFRDTKASTRTEVLKPRPRFFTKNIVPYSMENNYYNRTNDDQLCQPFSNLLSAEDEDRLWWDSLLHENDPFGDKMTSSFQQHSVMEFWGQEIPNLSNVAVTDKENEIFLWKETSGYFN